MSNRTKKLCTNCHINLGDVRMLPHPLELGHTIDGTWVNDAYLIKRGYEGRWVCSVKCYNAFAPSRRKRLFLELEEETRMHHKLSKGRFPRKDRLDKYLDIRKYIYLLFPDKRNNLGSYSRRLKPGLVEFSNEDLENLISRIKNLNRKLTSQKL